MYYHVKEDMLLMMAVHRQHHMTVLLSACEHCSLNYLFYSSFLLLTLTVRSLDLQHGPIQTPPPFF